MYVYVIEDVCMACMVYTFTGYEIIVFICVDMILLICIYFRLPVIKTTAS